MANMKYLATLLLAVFSFTTIQGAAAGPRAAACSRCAADVVFIIDGSSAVTPDDHENYIKPFLIKLLNGLGVSRDGVHVSLVQYGDLGNTLLYSYLNSSFDPEHISSQIVNISYSGGNSALYTALDLTRNIVLTNYRGARVNEWGKTVAPYVFLLTAGFVTDEYQGDPLSVTYKMLQDGIAVFGIGIGNLVTRDFVYSLTYDSSKAYMAQNLSMLLNPDFIPQLLSDSCCPMGFLKPTPRPPPAYCDTVDLMFLVDESLPMLKDPKNFAIVQDHMMNITDLFTVANKRTRVAAVGYGRSTKMHFHFNDLKDRIALHNSIRAMEYLGGARDTASAIDVAFQEIRSYSRRPMGVPVYLIHISQYAHDIGEDPIERIKLYWQLNVVVFAETVLEFRNDPIFDAETKAILKHGAPGSMQFTANTYKDLFNSGLREHLLNILKRDFPCKSPPSSNSG